MIKNLRSPYLFISTVFFATYLTGCGTHGSIKGYQYATIKSNLEKAVMCVIKNNSNIYRDTSLDYLGSSPALDHLGDNDSAGSYVSWDAGDNYYNDIKHYVTIEITSGQVVNSYTFRYYGGDKEWSTSTRSELFICYVNNKKSNDGFKRNGEITKTMAKEFTEIFEKEFVNKVDKELNLQHIDAE